MEEKSSKRIRLVFRDDDILTETQKSDGLNRSWVLLKPYQNDTVSDVASHLLHAFQLHQSCPHGLLLSVSGFVLPPFESTGILKDDEVIRVRKRREVLSITGNNAVADEVEKLRAAEKQPVNNGVLLLANDEFEKEKGGYESDEPEEELEEDVEAPKKRKRKAEEKIEGSNMCDVVVLTSLMRFGFQMLFLLGRRSDVLRLLEPLRTMLLQKKRLRTLIMRESIQRRRINVF
ncbi:hypothetical protein MIMGU_mgv11b024201mg, partial [Erythranthe guttata]